MVLVQGEPKREIIQLSEQLLAQLQQGDFDTMWDEFLSYRAKRLVSHSVLPIHLLKAGDLTPLLDRQIVGGLALAFEMDQDRMRSELFRAFTDTFHEQGWFELDPADWMVFATDNAALALNGSADKTLLLPFVRVEGSYAFDLEALFLFSEYISVRNLTEIATRALVHGHGDTADMFQDFARELAGPMQRINDLMLEIPLVQSRLEPARVEWLKMERLFVERVQRLGGVRNQGTTTDVNLSVFMDRFFRRYTESADIDLTARDLQVLSGMNDAKLRKAIAGILAGGVDRHQAKREATKSHGPAEIADMVIDVALDGQSFTLCMPFKSAREKPSEKTVPIDVIYQVWRPHMLLDNAVVVFITAKPCSQYLIQDIRMSMSRMGWPIAIIEHEALARLLKANGKLQ